MAKQYFGIQVFGTREEMAEFLTGESLKIARSAIARTGRFSFALSGGATPGDFYRKLSAASDAFPWDGTHIFLADERFVPLSDGDSNLGMIKSLLLDKIRLPRENVHSIAVDVTSPSEAAGLYERELKSFFGLSGHELPRFDLICLGIGEDGHTASLFPGSPEAEVPLLPAKVRLAVSVVREHIRHARISLTFPVINNAENVIFIVAGKNKAAIIKRVAGDRDQGFPAARVEPSDGRLLFVLDSEAASMLDKES